MKIGNIEFEKNIFLAPMAGVTDVAFRSIAEEFGAEMCYTEMISAKGLYYGSEKTKELMSFEPNTKYKAVQIFGEDAFVMGEIVKSFGTKYDIIDINMGCPAPKIFKNGEGSALMGDIEKARKIIETCVKNAKVPITVKFRSGITANSINAIEFAKMCENAGASAITIHARTREQFYSGKIDYEIVKQVVKSVKIPVIGSGDIIDKETYKKMLDCGVSAVMIGRGALGNPEIFSTLTNTTPPYNKLTQIKKHIEILQKYFDEHFITHYMRKQILWYLQKVPNSKEAKLQIVKCETIDELLSIAEKSLSL